MKETFYITTAIDYSNAPPHLGHAYEKITTDVIARHQRLRGKNVFFLTGLDEHGTKNEKAAKEKGVSPQEHCDEIAEKYLETWKLLNLSYDKFIRTTEDYHKKVISDIFQKLIDQGDVYKKKYSGLYCSSCESFYLEKDLTEEGLCEFHNRKPEIVEEENYFIKISKYKEKIKQYMVDNPEFIQPESRKNEVLNLIEDFEDVSVSRETVNWGIKVPNDDKQVIYVWVDALNNYITALGYGSENDDKFQEYWPANVQIVGKDIIKFHTIIWPTLLLAMNLPLPKTIYAHGFVTIGGAKISKTIGNVITPSQLVDKYQTDGVRYFLCREIFYGSDGDFPAEFNEDGSFKRCDILEKRVNADLANNLGNSLNRIISSILAKNCDGIIPDRNEEAEKDFAEFTEDIKNKVAGFMDNYEIHNALITIWDLVKKLNKYIDTEEPWTLARKAKEDEGVKPYFHGVLYTCLEALRNISILTSPFIPEIANRIWTSLGITETLTEQSWDDIIWGKIKPGTITKKGELIYPRIDSKLADKSKKKK